MLGWYSRCRRPAGSTSAASSVLNFIHGCPVVTLLVLQYFWKTNKYGDSWRKDGESLQSEVVTTTRGEDKSLQPRVTIHDFVEQATEEQRCCSRHMLVDGRKDLF